MPILGVCTIRAFGRRRAPLLDRPLGPSSAHRVDTGDRLDGTDEQRRRATGGLADDVQAVMHPVDKVHVGDPGWPVHDRVPDGPPEPGVGGLVVLADVRLDLDDPAGSAVRGAVPDQPAAEQGPAELQRRQLEDVAVRRRYRGLTGT